MEASNDAASLSQRTSSVPNFGQNQVLIRSPSTAVHVDMDDLHARNVDVDPNSHSDSHEHEQEQEQEQEPEPESEHESEQEQEQEETHESSKSSSSDEEPEPEPEHKKVDKQTEARTRLARRSMELAMRSKERLERARKANAQNSPKKEDPEATCSPRKFTSSLPGYLTEVVAFAQQHQVRAFRQSATDKM